VRGTVKDANDLRAKLLLEVDQHGPETQSTVNELFEKVTTHLAAIGRETVDPQHLCPDHGASGSPFRQASGSQAAR